MLLLKFAGLEFSEDRGGYRKAPNGKLPFIDDEGLIVADSTFIRFQIEKKYDFDFDAGLHTGAKRPPAWLDDANFCQEPRPILQILANAAPPDRPRPGTPQS
jgi:hypothetical protein